MKLGLLSFILYIFVLIIPLFSPALAHVLLTDKSVGAVVHITPDDDPIAGQTADFFFEFKDKENKFNPINCDCTYQIKQADKEIASGDLFTNTNTPSLENASFSLIFPERGIYTLTLTGKSKIPGEFDQFVLSDTIRIERTSDNVNNRPVKSDNFFVNHWIHLVVFGTGAVVFLVMFFFKVKKTD